MSSFNAFSSFLCYLSARTKEVKTLSSLSSRASGLSYSRMMPRFITITRSAFRMVWTRCCAAEGKKANHYTERLRKTPEQRCSTLHLALTSDRHVQS